MPRPSSAPSTISSIKRLLVVIASMMVLAACARGVTDIGGGDDDGDGGGDGGMGATGTGAGPGSGAGPGTGGSATDWAKFITRRSLSNTSTATRRYSAVSDGALLPFLLCHKGVYTENHSVSGSPSLVIVEWKRRELVLQRAFCSGGLS